MLALPPEQGVPVLDMRDELTVFQGLDNPNRWQGPFRGSPVRWKTPDGEAVVRALREAEANPVVRPLGRLATRRAGPTERHETTDGTVVVPEDDEGKTPEETGPAATTHTEIQFEIESTTSIYSGILRMSDLLAQQPNISVPLFLVAPDERRDEVIRQVNRPTFERMNPPLVDVCRYIIRRAA